MSSFLALRDSPIELSLPLPSPSPFPGRYYACSTHALAVNVISKRVEDDPASPGSKNFMYYLNDGLYGSFNCIMFDHVTPTPALVEVCVCVCGGGVYVCVCMCVLCSVCVCVCCVVCVLCSVCVCCVVCVCVCAV